MRIALKLIFIALFLFGCATQTRTPKSLYNRAHTPIQREKVISSNRGALRNIFAFTSYVLNPEYMDKALDADYNSRLKQQQSDMKMFLEYYRECKAIRVLLLRAQNPVQTYALIPESTKARCAKLGY